MELQRLQAEQRLIVRQRVRLMVNQYEVHAVQPDGSEGELLRSRSRSAWRSRSR